MTAHKCTIKELGYVSPNDRLLRIIVVMIIRIYLKDGLKGLQAHSTGHRPGYLQMPTFALKGQKLITLVGLLPFQGVAAAHRLTQGVAAAHRLTQGVALGYGLIAPSGRAQLSLQNSNN